MATVTGGPEAGPRPSHPHSTLGEGISENVEESLFFSLPASLKSRFRERTPVSLGRAEAEVTL